MEFLIADTHYLHKNILNFEKKTRGRFETAEEMTEYMIDAWNSVVSDGDTVYHDGDISINGSYAKIAPILERLNGNIILIQGNHDDTKVCKKLLENGLISELHRVGVVLKREKQNMWLTHYPMQIGLRERKWSIHGHIHSELSDDANQLNVGVDSYFMNEVLKVPFGQPVPLDKVVEYMLNNPITVERRN